MAKSMAKTDLEKNSCTPSSNVVPARRCAYIPTLRTSDACEPSLDPASYARTTCFKAGHLVTKNAGWRNMRPVIDARACTGCLQCYMYCPDGTIFKVKAQPLQANASDFGASIGCCDVSELDASASASAAAASKPIVAIDYDFCKGCGICARICKFEAIRMIFESEAHA